MVPGLLKRKVRRFARANSRCVLALTISLGVHASAALAAMLLGSPVYDLRLSLERPAGSSGAIQLRATMRGREQPLEECAAMAAARMLVTPRRAEFAQRTFVQSSTVVDRLLAEHLPPIRPVAPPPPDLSRLPAPPLEKVPFRAKPSPVPRQPPPAAVLAEVAAPPSDTRRSPLGSGGDLPPRLVRNAPPVYPPEAVIKGWEGTVLLRLFVSAEGSVARVEIVESSGHAVLDGTAVGAVRNWQFEPAVRGGDPIASAVRLPIRFALR